MLIPSCGSNCWTSDQWVPVTNQCFHFVMEVFVCRRLLLDICYHMCLDDLTLLLTDLRIHLVACLWRPSLTFHFLAPHQVPNRIFSNTIRHRIFTMDYHKWRDLPCDRNSHSANRVGLVKPTLSLNLLPTCAAPCTVMYCQTILPGLHWCRTFKPLMATWSCLKSLYVQLKRLVSIVWSRLKWCQNLLHTRKVISVAKIPFPFPNTLSYPLCHRLILAVGWASG